MEHSSQKTALITGASSGIGEAFARKLAEKGYHLILVARRQARLKALEQELTGKYSVKGEILVADLACEQDIIHVEQRILEKPPLDMLINNAGFGTPGAFIDIPLEKTAAMLNVHVHASTRLAWTALQGMWTKNRGAIINVSSMAALLPISTAVNYCATKAYLNTFSEALQWQLRQTNIRVQALCPGYTYSGFHETPEYQDFDRNRTPRWLWMRAEKVVECSLQALSKRSVIIVPGIMNRLIVWLMQAPGSVWLLRKLIRG
jgi:short-subunit dehydrogenase